MDKASGYRVAVLGATGSVGRGILNLLWERKFPTSHIAPLASGRSKGTFVSCGDQTLPVQPSEFFDFKTVDLVFSAVESHVAKTFIPKALQAGAWVIDKSSHFRMDPATPLVVPEVNGHLIKTLKADQRLIASPNCIATPLALALAPLHQKASLKRLVVSTYQSVSGAGKRAMDELFNQTRQVLSNAHLQKEVFSQQIAFNLIPQIGSLNLAGDSDEEKKVKEEVQKILACEIPIAVTCVRVPVFVGHAMSVWVELEEELSGTDVRSLLQKAPSLQVSVREKEADGKPFTPLDCAGDDIALISRVRRDKSSPNAFSLWICCDNLRKGAALNALQIAEMLHTQTKLGKK
ncbi:MAG: aspartate-semialdehyde dehydrogenase [Alphaproteobacteria bacterium]